ncbi:hypothetical protein MBLNU459_g8078t2 [Dothideomycetes sp. NU459]
MSVDSADEKTDEVQYHGNCHCGSFKFSLTVPPIKAAMQCNCSICSRKGYLHYFLNNNDALKVKPGSGTLSVYSFGKGKVRHKFCPTCSTAVVVEAEFSEHKTSLGVNIRALKHGEVDVDALQIKKYDGTALEPKYQPFAPAAKASEVLGSDSELKLYSGSCHCQAVCYTTKYTPLEKSEVLTCNCSWCARNADMWIYPPVEDVDFQGEENLTIYRFGEISVHGFCKVCGVDVVNRFIDPETQIAHRPINIRTMDNVDLEALEVTADDGWSREPLYQI